MKEIEIKMHKAKSEVNISYLLIDIVLITISTSKETWLVLKALVKKLIAYRS